MATLTDSLLSSSARKLPIRMRPDLSARRQQYLGRSYWVVKEPVGLNYFRFQEEEYAILQMLDGWTSLDEIKERFEAEFPPQKITLEELQQFLGMLHRSGLVVADVPGQGRELRKRRDQRRRKEILGSLTNILCIRFKGFDPERVLNRLYPYVRWCFSPVFLVLCCLLGLSALTLVVVEFHAFRSKLPDFYTFFSPKNAFLLALTLAFAKILHEFAHGLSCKHFGGECHEIGIMILVLTPCLYCNVSDSWMLPNKWHRAAIGAAGMFVEIVLASICTFIWWFTEPGLLHYLCLNVMFIASISTLLFNGNPLLRYDGYYILADVVEIPNLRQKATTILSRKLAQLLLGLEPPDDPFLPQRNQIFFVFYSVAAATYRWFILASILWFLFQVFKPYGLQVIGQAIVAMSIFGLVGIPLYKVGKFFYVPGRLDKVKKPHMYASLGVLTALLLAIIFIPLPHSVMCPLQIEARDADSVYVDVTGGGRLDEIAVKPGQQVTEGQRLAQLSNPALDLEVIRWAGKREEYRVQWRNLGEQIADTPDALSKRQTIKALLNTAEQQWAQKTAEQSRLRLTAPVDGTVLPPPMTADQPGTDDQLAGWSGTPLDQRNRGCHLKEGELFCQIGDPRRMEAVMVIDQTDRNFVKEGQTVEIKLDQSPSETLYTEIHSIAKEKLEVSPIGLATAAGGELPTKTDPATHMPTPQSASYQARASLDDPDGLLRVGLRGRAKVHTQWQPLGKRLWRLINHTFSFKL